MSCQHPIGEGADMRTAKRMRNPTKIHQSLRNKETETDRHTHTHTERERENGVTCKSLMNFCSSLAYSVENELNVEESLNDISLQMTSATTQNEKRSEREREKESTSGSE
jgi:type II secretory pathway component PulF